MSAPIQFNLGDTVTIKPDHNRKPAYCKHFGVGKVWRVTRSRVAVMFQVQHGSMSRTFKPESLILQERSQGSMKSEI